MKNCLNLETLKFSNLIMSQWGRCVWLSYHYYHTKIRICVQTMAIWQYNMKLSIWDRSSAKFCQKWSSGLIRYWGTYFMHLQLELWYLENVSGKASFINLMSYNWQYPTIYITTIYSYSVFVRQVLSCNYVLIITTMYASIFMATDNTFICPGLRPATFNSTRLHWGIRWLL